MYQTRWPRALALAACAFAALTACRGAGPAEPISASQGPPGSWFCQTSASGGWACRGNDGGIVLGPTRLPPKVNTEPQAPPTTRPVAEPAPRPVPVRAEPIAAPAPRPPAAPAVVEPAPAEAATLPLYRRLAYQPDGDQPLLELPSDFYALQLVAMSTQEEAERFAAARGLVGTATARVERDGRFYFVLLAGIYEDGEAAERAAISIEEALDGMEVWVRPLRTLQRAIVRADQLAGD